MPPSAIFTALLTILLLLDTIASAQEPRVQEILLPKEATNVSYSKSRGDIRLNFPGDMKQAGEFYRQTLTQEKWTKSAKDNLQKNFWVQTFTKENRELQVRADNRADGCEIRLTPKGFLWDEDLAPRPEDQIKLANAKAKKNAVATSSTAASGANVPQRPSKPARGIDKLEKLPSTASVTIDGKKIPLPEIIAYELISYGEWRTHIVATAQPVKQTSLLKLLQSHVPEEKWGELWQLPSPNVVWILNDDDSLRSVHLIADKVPGSSTAVTGEAIVEAGRARGTARLKPQKFFEHSYEAEISFDRALITASSEPRRLLENSPKLENAGKIIMAGKTYALPHVVAYEERNADRAMIHVLLTEKRIDAAKVLAALQQSGEVPTSLIGFQTQISLTLDQNDVLRSMFLWCDGASVNWSGKDSIQSSVQSEGDRLRGTARTVQKEEVLGKPFEFQASFDTSILRAPRAKPSK